MSNPHAPIKDFLRHHYRHFNARTLVEAAEAWVDQLNQGNKMFLAMAGAMSTAEIGLSLAEMIREGKIHGISCTGANLEEDLFNLVAHDNYEHVPNWRALTADEEQAMLERGMNRVTDTCIPEAEAMRKLESVLIPYWQESEKKGERLLPHEHLYRMILDGALEKYYQIDPKDSWMVAAAEANLPLFVPGWEDSTLGNEYVSCQIEGKIESLDSMLSGLDYMKRLVEWYREATSDAEIGFFQLGGGIAGDFPICVVPLIIQDLREKDAKLWSYFCQVSDSTTSFGSYSGAVPNEKITWGKLDTTGPKFVIESDATIVAPLVFSYVLAS